MFFPRSKFAALAVMISVAVGGCTIREVGEYFGLLDPADNPDVYVNPKFREAGAISGPVNILPIQDCSSEGSYEVGGVKVNPNERARKLRRLTFPKALWQAAKLKGEPKFGKYDYTDALCGELMGGIDDWKANAILRETIQSISAKDPVKKSILIMLTVGRWQSFQKKSDIRSSSGELIGSVDAEKVYWENDDGQARAYLLSASGEPIWGASFVCGPKDGHNFDCEQIENAPTAATRMFRFFPWQVF